jgi:hypothetical protein
MATRKVTRLPLDGFRAKASDPRDIGEVKAGIVKSEVVKSYADSTFDMPIAYHLKDYIGHRDDFHAYDSTATVGGYAEVSDGGTIAAEDGKGGVLSIATGGVDNNESYVSSITEKFIFETDKKLWFECKFALTEADTDKANFIIGLSDTVGANTLVDNGAGPAASYDGAVFFKVDGGTVFQFETSNAASQVTSTDVGDFTSATDFRVGFMYDYNDGVTAKVTPYIDGVQAGLAHDLTIAGLAEMHVLLGVKAGSGNAETLKVDYVEIVQER